MQPCGTPSGRAAAGVVAGTFSPPAAGHETGHLSDHLVNRALRAHDGQGVLARAPSPVVSRDAVQGHRSSRACRLDRGRACPTPFPLSFLLLVSPTTEWGALEVGGKESSLPLRIGLKQLPTRPPLPVRPWDADGGPLTRTRCLLSQMRPMDDSEAAVVFLTR